MEASKDAVASVDTNVLPEVQLSRLTEAPEGEDNPGVFLARNSWMDVGSYLGDDVQSKLTLLAMYFLREGAYDKAEMAIGQVVSLDPRVGRTLSHRRSLEMLDYPAATDTYRKYSSWPSETHLAQARAMIEIGAYDEARSALNQADPSPDRQLEMQRLAYLQGTAPAASAGPADNVWALLALAKAGDRTAEDLLVEKASRQEALPDGARLYIERFLLRHQAAARNDGELQKASNALSEEEAARLATRLATIARQALELGQSAHSRTCAEARGSAQREARGVRRPEGAARSDGQLELAAVSNLYSLHYQRRRY